ncbi:MAG TPA: adenylate/guanylate cyclase domain-containing protein [Streptosporangiaceae bacterium]|nr:adenylate/guanylate cyclase domain-containing protein [Streptosporangiaceae bacterium]
METLTFLFTDIESSTALLRRLGDGGYAQVLADHHSLIRSGLAAHGGEEVDTQGDAFFAVFSSAIACTERSGHQLIGSFLHNNASVHALRAGDIPAARAHLEQADKALQATRSVSHHVSVNLGWVLRQESDPHGAQARLEEGLRISRRNGERSDIAYASLGLACVAADLGDSQRAAELHGVAQAFLQRTGEQWQDPEARYRDDSLHQVRTSLGEEQAGRAYAKGMTLSLNQTLDLALGRGHSA